MVKSDITKLVEKKKRGELTAAEVQEYINRQTNALDSSMNNMSDKVKGNVRAAIERARSLLSPQSGEGQGSSGAERQ